MVAPPPASSEERGPPITSSCALAISPCTDDRCGGAGALPRYPGPPRGEQPASAGARTPAVPRSPPNWGAHRGPGRMSRRATADRGQRLTLKRQATGGVGGYIRCWLWWAPSSVCKAAGVLRRARSRRSPHQSGGRELSRDAGGGRSRRACVLRSSVWGGARNRWVAGRTEALAGRVGERPCCPAVGSSLRPLRIRQVRRVALIITLVAMRIGVSIRATGRRRCRCGLHHGRARLPHWLHQRSSPDRPAPHATG
jgi:hypothetical protein